MFLFQELDEDFDSDESSGKDWSELEEEAKRGTIICFYHSVSFHFLEYILNDSVKW